MKRLTMPEAIKAPNLVPLLDKAHVAKIGEMAIHEYAIDLESCDEFHKRYDRAMDVAMQVKKDKTHPWPGASNVVFPLLTTAAIQFQARAYPAVVDGGQVVKARVLGPDPDGIKRDRADRIAAHMSWQFLNDVPGWEEDTDRLLIQLPIVGCLFRKTWRDTLANRSNSETVTAKDLVVHYKTASFDKAPRFTHRQRYYPHEIEAYVRSGEWAEIHYEGDDGSDPHSLVEILEQHRLIDMDGDGLPEPYVVTCTDKGEVARIVACYDLDGIHLSGPLFDGQKSLADLDAEPKLAKGAKVVRIERREYFTKYGFIPAPDGSFYDIGFGTLTDNLGAAVNTIINQLIDAGTLANMQGGFIAGGTKIRGGNMRFAPGEWKRIEGASSGPLRDNILPLQLPGPNGTLFELLGMLVESVERICNSADILAGEQESQTAPTTALALIEQGEKVYTAIIKRIHRALGCEIDIMRGLNRDYLDEKQYFALNDDQPMMVGRADYEDRDLDVIPMSDPTAVNSRIRMARAQILMAHSGDPLVNQMEIRKREFEAAGIDNIKPLFEVPEVPPPPEAVKAMADTENETAKAKADVRAKDAATAASLIAAAKGAYELGALMQSAEMQQFALEMLGDAAALASAVYQAMEQANEPADGPGGVPGMGGPPADAGVPPLPEGPLPATGDGMGAELGPIGEPGDAVGAGPGGDAGGLGAVGM